MKNISIPILAFICLLASCKGNEPNPLYVYEQNPHYSSGYAEYFGAYYGGENGNLNNVISLSLFSDSLRVTNEGGLVGYGQYLFLEDIFIAPTLTTLPSGTYTLNDTGLERTVTPGINDTIDDEVYTLGATITYYESDAAKSILKRITEGTFKLTRVGINYTIVCDFKTSDNKELKGSFSSQLQYFDESLTITRSLGKRLEYLHR